MATSGGSVDERIDSLVPALSDRPPDPDELAALVRFFRDSRDRLLRKELDAATIAGPGEADAVERAAWTVLARVLLISTRP